MSNLGNKISDCFTNLIDNIKEFFEPLLTSINIILDYLNPSSDNFFLKLAFVPKDGFIAGKFELLKSSLLEKVPLIQQITDFFNVVKNTQGGTQPPQFTVTMPQKYGGKSYSIINFNYFIQYRTIILNFIRFTSWFFFLKKIYNRLPKIINS